MFALASGPRTHKRGRVVEPGAQKLNERVSYFLREADREICQADFRDGGACL
jgi:hypothetical protein